MTSSHNTTLGLVVMDRGQNRRKISHKINSCSGPSRRLSRRDETPRPWLVLIVHTSMCAYHLSTPQPAPICLARREMLRQRPLEGLDRVQSTLREFFMDNGRHYGDVWGLQKRPSAAWASIE
jgi:hypothetical protein